MVSINQTATLYQTISCFLQTPNKAWRKRSESINIVISLVIILLLRLYIQELAQADKSAFEHVQSN